MSLQFGPLTVPGKVMRYARPSRDPQYRRTHFFGVEGESQITGAVGGRTFAIPMLVYDLQSRFTTPKKMEDFLFVTVKAQQGKVGTLKLTTISDGTSHFTTYPECCLDSFVIRPVPGIIKDVAGLLGGDYFCEVDFMFRQL